MNPWAVWPLELIISNRLCDLRQITRDSFPYFKTEEVEHMITEFFPGMKILKFYNLPQ